jgi:hypothetical protein
VCIAGDPLDVCVRVRGWQASGLPLEVAEGLFPDTLVPVQVQVQVLMLVLVQRQARGQPQGPLRCLCIQQVAGRDAGLELILRHPCGDGGGAVRAAGEAMAGEAGLAACLITPLPPTPSTPRSCLWSPCPAPCCCLLRWPRPAPWVPVTRVGWRAGARPGQLRLFPRLPCWCAAWRGRWWTATTPSRR